VALGQTPRNAAGTVLHQVVREHLERCLATTARADPAGLPTFLEQEFRGFPECGTLCEPDEIAAAWTVRAFASCRSLPTARPCVRRSATADHPVACARQGEPAVLVAGAGPAQASEGIDIVDRRGLAPDPLGTLNPPCPSRGRAPASGTARCRRPPNTFGRW
jgi:hypothetical protein